MIALVGEVRQVHFGEWLREQRRKADMTLDELAEGSGRSKNYLSILERNTPHHKTGALPNPSRAVLEDIARGLHIAPLNVKRAWAQYGNGSTPESHTVPTLPSNELTDAERNEIISSFEGVPRPLREKALNIVKMLLEDLPDPDDVPTFGKRTSEDVSEQ